MGEFLKQSVFIENRSQGTVFGLEVTSRAAPDGYNISVTASSGYINAVLGTKLPFNIKTDLEPIIQLTAQPYLLVVHPSVKVSSVEELLALAKNKPGALNYASSGNGSAQHVGMELFKLISKTNMVHIPYKGGGPALADLVAGRTQVFLASPISGMQFIKTNKLHALAVTTAQRAKGFPDLPTVSEAGVPGFELNSWYGMVAPKGISAPHVDTLFKAASYALHKPEVENKFAADGSEVPKMTSPSEFRSVVAKEIEQWEQFSARTNFRLAN
jgi:tripartite-type tricarboxylate transporter receptor subunit TctC